MTCTSVTTPVTCSGNGNGSSTANVCLNAIGSGTAPQATSNPYPVPVAVSGLTGTVATVTVQLNGFYHSDPEDLAMQLVAPDGSTNLVFMSDTGGFNSGVSNLTLAFSDSAGSFEPGSGNTVTSGTYKPTCSTADGFGSPNFAVSANFSAPEGTHTLNGTFAGLSAATANGTWKLYINDYFGAASGDTGSISSYSVTITTSASAVGTTTSVVASPAQVFTTSPGNSTTLTATVTASGTAVTSGNVSFTDNGSTISGSPVALNSSGMAALVYTGASGEGTHTIVATYNGATGDLGSSGNTSLVVANHPTISGSNVCNGPITLATAVDQPSSPYGSRLYVSSSSYSGTVSAVTLSLNGVTSPDASSFALLLASPGGSKFFIPMDEIGFNSSNNFSVSGINLVLEDSASNLMPSGAQLNAGTYLPTAYLPTNTLTSFPSPAPTATTSNYAATVGNATFASSFGGVDPVGTSPNNFWQLFVTNTTGSTASINQWCLSFVTTSAPASTTVVTSSENPSFTGDSVTLTATVTVGGSPVTQGTITFKDGSTTLSGPTTLNGSGQVTYTTSSFTEGTHNIEALYSGATGVANVSTGTLTQVVNNHTVISNGGLTFCNPGTISLPSLTNTATPYPSLIFVSGVPGTVNNLQPAINGFTRSDPSGTAVLLAGPQIQNGGAPQNLVLFSEAGDNTGSGGPFSVSNVNLTFADGHAALPQFAQITSGTYGSSFYNTYGGSIVFPAPAPSTYNTTGTLAAEFGSSNPNGTWQLFPLTAQEGTGNGTFSSWCITFAENAPSLTVTKTSSGSFEQGSTTGQFTISVANNGPGSTGTATAVTVTDTMPAGLSVAAITATNWSCTTVLPATTISCSRSDALAASSSYPNSIVLTVSVASNATTGSRTNTASVTGGGSANNTSGSAMVTVTAAPSLGISKMHTGTFTQGQTATWSVQVSNVAASGSASTGGTTTMVDTLPTGYTLASFVGTNWSCSGTTTVNCTTSQVVAPGGTFSLLTLTVNVPANSPVSVTNNASAFGGGDLVHTNSGTAVTTTDTAAVVQVPASIAVNTGNNQSATVNTAFTTPLSVIVKDAGSVAINGVTVTFTAPSSGASGTFANSTIMTTASTNSSGIATASSFTANATSGGPYSVSASATGAGSTNFSLTNLAAGNVITFNPLPNQTFGAAPFMVSATASSGLTVSFASTTPATCSVNVTQVTLIHGGTCTIQATQGGNGTFAPATPVNQSFQILAATPQITWATPAAIIYGGTLGSAQLDATVNAPGTLTYNPPAGTVLPVGNGQTLTVNFTPADSGNYTTASATVLINVTPIGGTAANLVITSVLSRDPSTQNVIATITVANTGGTGATNVQISTATLASIQPITALPVSLGSIAASAQTTVVITFPSTVGTSGSRAVLSIAGTYSGTNFGSNGRVVLP
jgi:subtilisin-like proprotein convertase family protein